MKIGYQGDVGSNNEAASLEFIKKYDPKRELKWELIPLLNSGPVLSALDKGEIDFGCCAVMNSLAGEVVETKSALRNRNPEVVEELSLPIHHCLFVKNGKDIDKCHSVLSHVQALAQTKINRKRLFPNLKEVEVKDQALAARLLSENKFDDGFAVICKKDCGLKYGLHLVYENLEDNKNNFTVFNIYKRG